MIQAGLQFIKYDPVSMHPVRLYSLPMTVLRRTIPPRLKMKTKRWAMKATTRMTRTMAENLTSMCHTSNTWYMANRGAAGILMTRIQATKSDDQPPRCWQRWHTHARTCSPRFSGTYLLCLSRDLGIENKPSGSKCGQPIQRYCPRFRRMVDRL